MTWDEYCYVGNNNEWKIRCIEKSSQTIFEWIGNTAAKIRMWFSVFDVCVTVCLRPHFHSNIACECVCMQTVWLILPHIISLYAFNFPSQDHSIRLIHEIIDEISSYKMPFLCRCWFRWFIWNISSNLTPSCVIVGAASFSLTKWPKNHKEFIVRSQHFDYSSKMTHDRRNYLALLLCAIFMSIFASLSFSLPFLAIASLFFRSKACWFQCVGPAYTYNNLFRYESSERERRRKEKTCVFVCMRRSCTIHWTKISAFFTHDLHSLQ